MFDPGSSGNWEHHLRFPKQPRERDLRGLCLEALRCPRKRTIMFREFAGREWKPRDEADVFPSAILQHVLGISVHEIISILHRNDRGDPPNRLDLLNVDFRQSNVANLALALKIDECADLIFHRYFRVNPMQLEQIASRKIHPPKTTLDCRPQILRPAILDPFARPRPLK